MCIWSLYERKIHPWPPNEALRVMRDDFLTKTTACVHILVDLRIHTGLTKIYSEVTVIWHEKIHQKQASWKASILTEDFPRIGYSDSFSHVTSVISSEKWVLHLCPWGIVPHVFLWYQCQPNNLSVLCHLRTALSFAYLCKLMVNQIRVWSSWKLTFSALLGLWRKSSLKLEAALASSATRYLMTASGKHS